MVYGLVSVFGPTTHYENRADSKEHLDMNEAANFNYFGSNPQDSAEERGFPPTRPAIRSAPRPIPFSPMLAARTLQMISHTLLHGSLQLLTLVLPSVQLTSRSLLSDQSVCNTLHSISVSRLHALGSPDAIFSHPLTRSTTQTLLRPTVVYLTTLWILISSMPTDM
jgi:hypothetical protein